MKQTSYFSKMKAATVNELKVELSNVPAAELIELCVRLAKFKKENKELLTYLLFESFDEEGYIRNVKEEMKQQFDEINYSSLYFVKKSLRKILRITNKYIRYTGSTNAEVNLLLFFCNCIQERKIPMSSSPALHNIYLSQIKKITKCITGMHEDLQFDYLKELKLITA